MSEAGISHNSSDGILTCTVEGGVSVVDMTTFAVRIQDEFVRHKLVLWDIRSAQLVRSMSSRDLMNLRHSFAEILELRSGRTAILVREELFELTNLVITQFQDTGVKFRVFTDEPQTLAWLRAETDAGN